jgi:hypothetical protein
MIRTCPKCRAYYADALLAFCLADGTPLVNVSPSSENWREGARVIEERSSALQKKTRKMKWRRAFMSAMTAVIATVVVCVVAINGLIYLRPQAEADDPVTPLTQAASPIDPSAPIDPVVSPTPVVTKVKPVTARTPVPSLSPTPTPPPQCAAADKSREERSIVERYGATWRRNIEGEGRQIIAALMPAGAGVQDGPRNADGLTGFAKPEVTLGSIEYETRLTQACAASVTARYVWQVRRNVNGHIEVSGIKKEKRFACVKSGESWRCG